MQINFEQFAELLDRVGEVEIMFPTNKDRPRYWTSFDQNFKGNLRSKMKDVSPQSKDYLVWYHNGKLETFCLATQCVVVGYPEGLSEEALIDLYDDFEIVLYPTTRNPPIVLDIARARLERKNQEFYAQFNPESWSDEAIDEYYLSLENKE